MTLIGSGTITRKLVGSATLGTLAPTTTGGIEIDLLEGGDSASSFGGESPATVQITVRKDTSANWSSNNPVLGIGEFGYIIEDKQLFVGDGVTAYVDLTDSNYIVHWDDLTSALNAINNSIANLESSVIGNTNDIATLESDLSSAQASISGLINYVSSLQTSVNTHESEITTLQSDVSTLQSDLTNNVSDLLGQIDTLSGGVMMKYTLQFNASDVPSIEGSPYTIITPTSGKTLLFIAACVSVVCSSPTKKPLDFQFNNGASYPNPISTISVSDDVNATTSGLVNVGLPYLTDKQPLELLLTNGGVEGGDAQYTLTIFYMEV